MRDRPIGAFRPSLGIFPAYSLNTANRSRSRVNQSEAGEMKAFKREALGRLIRRSRRTLSTKSSLNVRYVTFSALGIGRLAMPAPAPSLDEGGGGGGQL